MTSKDNHNLNDKRDLVIVASFPRSGTHFLLDTLRINFSQLSAIKWPLQPTHKVLVDVDRIIFDSQKWDKELLSVRNVTAVQKGVLGKTHSYSENWSDDNAPIKILKRAGRRPIFIYAVRDPVKTFASAWAYLSLLKYDVPDRFMAFVENYPANSILEWSENSDNIINTWAKHVKGWLNRHNALVINTDTLLHSSAEHLQRIAQYICLSPRQNFILPKAPTGLFDRIFRRLAIQPNSTTVIGPPRPTIPQNEARLVRFKAFAQVFGEDSSRWPCEGDITWTM